MKQFRESRKKASESFFQTAKIEFDIIKGNDESAKALINMFSLSYPPQDGNRRFNISLGNRCVDNNNNLYEKGSALHYEELDNCKICVMLYPVTSDNMRTKEDFIFLHKGIDPQKLTSKALQKHWNYFVAYSEVTCLDGQPTFWQQLNVYYLRWFKHLVVKKKYQSLRILRPISFLLRLVKDIKDILLKI
jgi:hypothetical protein